MPNEIDVLVQAEMTGTELNADQEEFVRAMVEEARERAREQNGCELEPEEALAVVQAALVKIMDIEAGVDENGDTEPSSEAPVLSGIIGSGGIIPFWRKPKGPSKK